MSLVVEEEGLSSISSQQEEPQQRSSYKQATGRFKLLCTFDAVFSKKKSDDPVSGREINLKTAKILKTIVLNARTKRDTKYQTIQLNNPKICEYIVSNEAAMDLLQVVGFEKRHGEYNTSSTTVDDDEETTATTLLVYNPKGVEQIQFASRLDSLLEEKISKLLRDPDDATSTPTQKRHKSTAKANQREAKNIRKQELLRFQDDRDRNQMFNKN